MAFDALAGDLVVDCETFESRLRELVPQYTRLPQFGGCASAVGRLQAAVAGPCRARDGDADLRACTHGLRWAGVLMCGPACGEEVSEAAGGSAVRAALSRLCVLQRGFLKSAAGLVRCSEVLKWVASEDAALLLGNAIAASCRRSLGLK